MWIGAGLAAVLVLLTLPPFAENDAPEPCMALERRIGASLSAPGLLRRFGLDGHFGRIASQRRLPYVPHAVGCTVGWWHVLLVQGAAPGWFAAMR